MLPNHLMRFKGLSSTAKLVWGRLAQYAGKDGLCHPSYKMLGAECGISKRQAISIIKELISKGFIEKTVSTDRERQRRFYAFLWHPCFEGDSISPAGDNISPPGEAEFSGVDEVDFTGVGWRMEVYKYWPVCSFRLSVGDESSTA